MDKLEFKKTAEKAGNKPFLVVLALIVLGVCVILAFTLSKAVNNKIAEFEKQNTTEQVSNQNEATEASKPSNDLNVGTVKTYVDNAENVYITKEAARIAVTVEFKDEESLLDEHYAANAFSIDVTPVFCFYVNNGTQIKVPGELRLLSDGKSVVYYLSEINDLKNAVAQTEAVTVTLDNVMTNDFNVYIQHKTRNGVGKTVLGTYGKSVEQFKASYLQDIPKSYEVNKDIKLIEVTAVEEFVWVDVYFENQEAYNKYAGDGAQSFMCFGFEHAGNLYKENFIVSEYKSINMLRLKFDNYAFAPLLKEMNEDEMTVKDLFADYAIEIWATDYKNETPLFCLNEKIEVREKLNNSMSGSEIEGN